MLADKWQHCSCARSSHVVTADMTNPQVSASPAKRCLGDLPMAQQQHGSTAVVPVVPWCQVSRATGTTVRSGR